MKKIISNSTWSNSIGGHTVIRPTMSDTPVQATGGVIGQIRGTAVPGPEESAEERELRESKLMQARQIASRDDYVASKDRLSRAYYEAADKTDLTGAEMDAEVAACLALVQNPMDQAQVDAMKACFQQKIDLYNGQRGSGSGDKASSAMGQLIPGLSNRVTGAIAIILIGVLGYFGYKYYKTHHGTTNK